MQVSAMLQGESLKRLLQGAAVGAVATIAVGFGWGGWSFGSTADRMAKERSEVAVVASRLEAGVTKGNLAIVAGDICSAGCPSLT